MATWTGWESQFLTRAGIVVTPPNKRFLDEWAARATSNCPNNPIDLGVQVKGSSNCAAGTGFNPHTQRYPSHTSAAHAFAVELDQSYAKALRAALNSGNPFQYSGFQNVVSDLVTWGSDKFANYYLGQMTGGSGSGGSTGQAPHTHSGWAHLRRVVNHDFHTTLRDSEKTTNAALRSLARAHKVKG